LTPFTDLLGVDVPTLKKVLASWGPGCFDAELDKDGKALRPDGKRACTLIPPALGLAGVNLHTWTGFGSVPYWNAYVAATEMNGSGTFFDAKLSDPKQYPVAAKSGAWNSRGKPDRVTSKLAALHFYQLAIPAPRPPEGSFDKGAAERGKGIFDGKGKCAVSHIHGARKQSSCSERDRCGLFPSGSFADTHVPYGPTGGIVEPHERRVLP
jgi:hypothetical protein